MSDPIIKLEDLPEMLSIEDIAGYMRVTRPVITTMIDEYNIPTIKVGKKLIRINKNDFKTFLDSISKNEKN